MTSNYYIEYLLQSETSFLGCFHINNLPPCPKTLPASLIIYRDKHWTSLKIVDNELCLYFDSFGERVHDIKLINYLSSTYQYIIYNSVQIQHDLSDKCGLFCVLFIRLVTSLSRFKDFVQLFDKYNLYYNDHILANGIKFT